MAKKELDAILEAEKAVAGDLDAAKAKAKKILAAAETEAGRLFHEAIESAHSEVAAISKQSSETVAQLERETSEEAQKEIARLHEMASAKFDEAISVIVTRVKKAI